MENTKHLSIPYKGLNDGNHSFQFEIYDEFFKFFENEQINNGRFTIHLDFEKKPGVNVMEFQITGHSRMNCDRCMEDIYLPMDGNFRMLLKFGDEEESNDEVLYVDPEISILPLGKLIYEYILLSIPMVKVYNCEDENPQPCNLEILDKLETESKLPTESNSIWENLKGIDFENN